jgi:hypothetical protein
MIDAFPFGSWDEVEGAFWQYSGGAGAGTWALTVIGMIVTAIAIIGWVYMDNQMLTRHAERLRAAGFGRSAAGGPPGPEGSGSGSAP